MEHVSRRDDTKKALERIVLWGMAISALIAAATAVVRVKDTVEQAPVMARKVRRLEKRVDVLEWWLPAIGKKLGVPAPPPGFGKPHDDKEDQE